MPTLSELSQYIPKKLVPVYPRTAPSIEVAGVHISELEDPRDYVHRGELLLTTGLNMTLNPERITQFVQRISSHGVAALVLGLGPVFISTPADLEKACEECELPLLVVPDPYPFMDIVRALWAIENQGGSTPRWSTDAILRMIRSALRLNGRAELIRIVGSASNSLAFYVPFDGSPPTVWPASSASVLNALAKEVSGLQTLGPNSTKTFPFEESDVIAYSVSAHGKVSGALVIVLKESPSPETKRLLDAASGLLALKLEQEQQLEALPTSLGAATAGLVMAGFTDAARSLAFNNGLRPMPSPCRVLILRRSPKKSSDPAPDFSQAQAVRRSKKSVLDRASSTLFYGDRNAEFDYFLTPIQWNIHSDWRPLRGRDLAGSSDNPGMTSGALSRVIALEDVPACIPGLLRQAIAAHPGTVFMVDSVEANLPFDWQLFCAMADAELHKTVMTFLSRGFQVQQTARDLGIHRNTLKGRLNRAETILGAKLENPDVYSTLWPLLRT